MAVFVNPLGGKGALPTMTTGLGTPGQLLVLLLVLLLLLMR
jgi:hypothetical protein